MVCFRSKKNLIFDIGYIKLVWNWNNMCSFIAKITTYFFVFNTNKLLIDLTREFNPHHLHKLVYFQRVQDSKDNTVI